MRQVLFRIPGLNLPLYGFGIMIVVGFYLGLLLAVRRSKRENLDPNVIYDLIVWLLIGGMVGARLFCVVEYWDQIETFTDIFKIWEGGIVFYGSVIGATAGFFLARLVRPFPILKTLDVLAPSIALGIAFGRVGCFLNGCCYGDVCPFRWLAVHFPPNSPAWNAERARGLIPVDAPTSLPLHPTQLYAAIDGLVLFRPPGGVFPASPTCWRSDRAAHDDLPDHAVSDRAAPRRRAGLRLGPDDLAGGQSRFAAERADPLGMPPQATDLGARVREAGGFRLTCFCGPPQNAASSHCSSPGSARRARFPKIPQLLPGDGATSSSSSSSSCTEATIADGRASWTISRLTMNPLPARNRCTTSRSFA